MIGKDSLRLNQLQIGHFERRLGEQKVLLSDLKSNTLAVAGETPTLPGWGVTRRFLLAPPERGLRRGWRLRSRLGSSRPSTS